MSDNIPFDIQLEIIKKVPDVKSLTRLRSVSKSWMSFIDSPEFIAFYGVRHTQPRRLLLRYKDLRGPRELKYISFIDDVTFPQQQLDFAPNVSDLVRPIVIGSSCGLWCFNGFNSSRTEMVVIWNPSIRKSVRIVMPLDLNSTSPKFSHFGFGVCPSTYDPTIVGFSWYFAENQHNTAWQVGIFTLSSKTWKMIPTSNVHRESIILGSSTQVAIDMFIFWVAYNTIVGNNLILSFDLITREFKEVNLPVSIANEFASYISISELNESLVVSAYTNDEVDDGRVYGVWIMGKEGGVITSFTKLFNINTPDLIVGKVLGYKKSGEPIMATAMEDKQFAALEVYEPCLEHISSLEVCGENDSLFIFPYKETLLLADH